MDDDRAEPMPGRQETMAAHHEPSTVPTTRARPPSPVTASPRPVAPASVPAAPIAVDGPSEHPAPAARTSSPAPIEDVIAPPAATPPPATGQPAPADTPAPAASPAPVTRGTWWRRIKWVAKAFALLTLTAVVLLAALILLYRYVNPPYSTLMAWQRLTGTPITQSWVPLDRVSPLLIRAVIVSEDSQFCRHRGIDLAALEEAIERAGDGGLRGASTISMQVAKNLYLWPSKSYLRKALEIPITLAMELVWPKTRVLEIYLNIAEWGPGIFGIEAASQYHFGKPSSRLTEREAALLAVALPDPIGRVAGDPGPGTARLASIIQSRMRGSLTTANCILKPK